MLLWEVGSSKDATHNKNERSIWVEAKSVYSAWFNVGLMQTPKQIHNVCEYFSFVKPWAIDDIVLKLLEICTCC
jgi:hypothetical protein